MPERITLTPDDPRYPPRLLDVSSDPPAFRVDGDAGIPARRDLVAVCGARKCTPYGMLCSQETGRTVAVRAGCHNGGRNAVRTTSQASRLDDSTGNLLQVEPVRKDMT